MFDWLRRKRPGHTAPTGETTVAAPAEATDIPLLVPEDEDDLLPDIGSGPVMLRPLESSDQRWLPRIFRAAIHEQGAAFYTRAQCDAWAAGASDEAAFNARLTEGVTIVADLDGRVGAFAQLHPADTFSMLYVAPGVGGYGIATLLYQYLEDEARIAGSARLQASVSLAGKRFFEQMGFRSEGVESVERQGQLLERHTMVKALR